MIVQFTVLRIGDVSFRVDLVDGSVKVDFRPLRPVVYLAMAGTGS